MASIYAALSGTHTDPKWISPVPDEEDPKGDGEEGNPPAVFRRLWYSSEVIRVVAANEDDWETRFETGLAAVLRPEQRATLPGGARRVS